MSTPSHISRTTAYFSFDKQYVARQAKNRGWTEDMVITDSMNRYFVLGMQLDRQFRDNWILKGGACLSICYETDTFRYTPDLDFTVHEGFLEKEDIIQAIQSICIFLKNQSKQTIIFYEPKATRADPGYIKLKIPYEISSFPKTYKIEIDVTSLEKIIVLLPNDTIPSQKMIIPGHPLTPYIKCYSIEEVFAEKLRASVEKNNELTDNRKLLEFENDNKKKKKIKKKIKNNEKKIAKNIYDLVDIRRRYGGYIDMKKLIPGTIKKKFEHKDLYDFPQKLQEILFPKEFPLKVWETEVSFNILYEAKNLKNYEHFVTTENARKKAIKFKEMSIKGHMFQTITSFHELISCILELNDMETIPDFHCFNDFPF